MANWKLTNKFSYKHSWKYFLLCTVLVHYIYPIDNHHEFRHRRGGATIQFGGLKGNSISHYMIELVNYVLHNQDYNLPIVVLIYAVDLSKAFNRINHNLIIGPQVDFKYFNRLFNWQNDCCEIRRCYQ